MDLSDFLPLLRVQEITQIIIQYLNNEGLHQSATTLLNEKQNQLESEQSALSMIKSIYANIQSGDWNEVERLVTTSAPPSTPISPPMSNEKVDDASAKFNALRLNRSAFLYEVYKQQFLEMIDNGEMQKAFTFLSKKLKPLKAMQSHENEFKDLCYLLTCKSVQEAESFRNWDGPMISR